MQIFLQILDKIALICEGMLIRFGFIKKRTTYNFTLREFL